MSEPSRAIPDTTHFPPERATQLSRVCLITLGVAGAATLLGWISSPQQFYFSYLTAFTFVASLACGALFWVLLHHLVDAGWSVVVRRLMEHLCRTNLWLGLLFLPLVVALFSHEHGLYHWTHIDPEDTLLVGKQRFLNTPFFLVRTLVYLAVWGWLAWRFTGWSSQQDRSHDVELTRRMQGMSAPGMLLLGLTAAFAGIDWIMTLDPHWFSTMFGVYFWAGSILGSMAALTAFVVALRRAGFLTHSITEEHLHDLGKLLFAFVIFWAYIAFCQYFLIWYADIPEERPFYTLRFTGSWYTLGLVIVFGHVILPFLFLLSRSVKRNPTLLGLVAVWILVMHFLELHWQILPVLHPEGMGFHWLDVTTLLLLVAGAGLVLLRALSSYPLLPVGDPRLQESLDFHNI